jgi:(hydroxyamino)benzene mutase
MPAPVGQSCSVVPNTEAAFSRRSCRRPIFAGLARLQQVNAYRTEAAMNSSEMLSRQGRYLLQLGVVLFLFTSFEGFIIPALAAPNLGRSVHTLSGFVGVLFLAMGLMWPMLKLGATASRIAFWFLIYSSLATIAGFVVAAFLGVGGSIIPIAAQGMRGSDLQEAMIQAVMYPAAPTGIVAFGLILWGLRAKPN